MIPESIIKEVKEQSELVAVVEQYVRLERKSGSNYFGLCPFHNEKTPSFSVSPAKQIYYCFGCHKGGDVIHFMMEIEKCSYPQAIKLLAERAGIQIPEPDDAIWQQRNERNKMITNLYLEAARHYYRNLMSEWGKPAQAYLKNRGMSASICKKFGVGYALDAWDGLLLHLNNLGFTDNDLLLQSGLFKRSKNGGLYDLFRNRLMFPIFDAMGRMVAFGGRVLDDRQPKYINSPETAIYKKGRHLFALNLAKASKKKELVIVEGYMDVLALHQAGMDQAVASLGTALTDDQAQLLRKYTEHVVVAYDADLAGQTAALRSLDILSGRGLNVSVLMIPDAKDPDEFIRKHGPERFQALIDKAMPLLDYKLFVARQNSMRGKTLDPIAYQESACEILAQEKNAIVRELYATRLAEEINATPETVFFEIERRLKGSVPQNRFGSKQSQEKTISSPNVKKTGKQPFSKELFLLSLVAAEPSLIDEIGLTADDFSPGTLRSLAQRVLESAKQGSLDTALLIELCGDLSIGELKLHDLIADVSMRLDELLGPQNLKQAATEQLWRQRLFRLRCQIKELRRQIEIENDPEKCDRFKNELLQATRHLTELKQKRDRLV